MPYCHCFSTYLAPPLQWGSQNLQKTTWRDARIYCQHQPWNRRCFKKEALGGTDIFFRTVALRVGLDSGPNLLSGFLFVFLFTESNGPSGTYRNKNWLSICMYSQQYCTKQEFIYKDSLGAHGYRFLESSSLCWTR